MSNITAIINIFKRPHTLDTQLNAIRAQSIPPKCIFIWNNGNKDVDLTKYKEMPDVRVFDNNVNFGVWSRFLIGFLAPTEYVCILDDDTVPGTKWFENCLTSMKKRVALYGTMGLIFNQFNEYSVLKKYGCDNPCDISMPVDIVNHSWFFRKEWLQYFVREEPQVYNEISNSEDIHFSFMLQKYASIPTYVPPHPEYDISLWGSQPNTAWESTHNERNKTDVQELMYKEYLSRGFSLLVKRQNTTSDLDLNMFKEKILNVTPFAVIRPSDGEYYVLQNQTLTNCDNWTFTAGGKLSNDLKNAVELAANTSCYVGIPCECDIKSMGEWYYKTFKLHPLYTTFANIFVNANWKEFIEFLKKVPFTFIGPKNNNSPFLVENFIQIPEFLVNEWDTKGEEFINNVLSTITKSKNKVFLFSCGPIAKILIAKAWAAHPYNIYMDVGSSLDLFLKGSTNRFYISGEQKYCAFSSSLITI